LLLNSENAAQITLQKHMTASTLLTIDITMTCSALKQWSKIMRLYSEALMTKNKMMKASFLNNTTLVQARHNMVTILSVLPKIVNQSLIYHYQQFT